MLKINLYNEDAVLVDSIFCEDEEYVPFEVEQYCSSHNLEIDSYKVFDVPYSFEEAD